MLKKSLAVLLFSVLFNVASAANEEVSCSSDAVFSEYSCNQCFNGWVKSEWVYIGLLSDQWVNTSDNSKIVFKEQQDFPELINLDTDNVEWDQTPEGEDFWEYTDEFNSLYSETEDGYILESGESVSWLKSKLWYAYKLERNESEENSNIGLLVYWLLTNTILDDGTLTSDNTVHNECVIYKSGEKSDEAPVELKRLPETGPKEMFVLLVLAMILGFGLVRLKKEA